MSVGFLSRRKQMGRVVGSNSVEDVEFPPFFPHSWLGEDRTHKLWGLLFLS